MPRSYTYGMFFCLLWLLSCASAEPRLKRGTTFQGVPLDLSLLRYEDLSTGKDVNVANYLDENRLSHILLVFGSIGCQSCNEKAMQLSQSYLGAHQLFIDSQYRHFQLLGVNVDQGTAKRQFERVWSNQQTRQEIGYEFVTWRDNEQTIETYYLEPGERVTIPFMVLLSRQGIVRRYLSSDERSIGEILNDVLETLGGVPSVDDIEPPPQRPVTPSTPQGVYRWQIPVADRFFDLPVTNCLDPDHGVNAHEFLPAGATRYLQIYRGECGNDCRKNDDLLGQEVDRCSSVSKQSCTYRKLRAVEKDETCLATDEYLVDQDVFDTFKTLFDWNADHYPPIVGEFGLPIGMPEFSGPLVLGFSGSGQLNAAVDGQATAADVRAAYQRPMRGLGAGFSVLGSTNVEERPSDMEFHELLQHADYTVLSMYGLGCSACEDDLVSWTSTNLQESPVSLCRESPEFCQVQVLEKAPAESYRLLPRELHQLILERFDESNIDLPLLISTGLLNWEFSRFYEAYLEVLYPEMFGQSAAVIYDREGKLLGSFVGGGVAQAREIRKFLEDLQKVKSTAKQ